MTNRQQLIDRSTRLLAAINHALDPYKRDIEPRELLDSLLGDMIDLTGSEYGFFGEVLHKANGLPYMKLHAIPNLKWSEKTGASSVAYAPRHLDIANLDTLFGAVVRNSAVVISNDPANDPRTGMLPEGYPVLNTFLGMPFNAGENLAGVIGVVNSPDGYEESLVDFLQPLLKCYLQLFHSHAIDLERRAALSSLEESEQLIRGMAIPAVEHEHDELIDLINECYEEMEREADAETIIELFNRTYTAIARHFLHEEQLMRNAVYPEYLEHKENHDNLLTTLRDHIDRFIEDPDHDVYLLQKTLADWFGRHVATFDLRLNEYFSN